MKQTETIIVLPTPAFLKHQLHPLQGQEGHPGRPRGRQSERAQRLLLRLWKEPLQDSVRIHCSSGPSVTARFRSLLPFHLGMHMRKAMPSAVRLTQRSYNQQQSDRLFFSLSLLCCIDSLSIECLVRYFVPYRRLVPLVGKLLALHGERKFLLTLKESSGCRGSDRIVSLRNQQSFEPFAAGTTTLSSQTFSRSHFGAATRICSCKATPRPMKTSKPSRGS